MTSSSIPAFDLIRFSGFRCKPDGFWPAKDNIEHLWGPADVVTKSDIIIDVIFGSYSLHRENISITGGLTRKELLETILDLYKKHLPPMDYDYFRNEHYISGVEYQVTTQYYMPVVEAW